MKKSQITGIYSLIIGISMIGMWIMFLVTNNVPELSTTPWEIGFHILAELITASLLIFASIGLLRDYNWRFSAYFVGTGMLLYSIISEGLGYYVQRSNLLFIGMFISLLIFTLGFFGLTILEYYNKETLKF